MDNGEFMYRLCQERNHVCDYEKDNTSTTPPDDGLKESLSSDGKILPS